MNVLFGEVHNVEDRAYFCPVASHNTVDRLEFHIKCINFVKNIPICGNVWQFSVLGKDTLEASFNCGVVCKVKGIGWVTYPIFHPFDAMTRLVSNQYSLGHKNVVYLTHWFSDIPYPSYHTHSFDIGVYGNEGLREPLSQVEAPWKHHCSYLNSSINKIESV